jgi:large subunit ribosomal protein L13
VSLLKRSYQTPRVHSHELEFRWFLLNAEGKILGRLAVRIATLLRGKNRPSFTPQVECGDQVIVVNASKVVVTGKKSEQKLYRRHSGYPGGFREVSYERMVVKHPERIIEHAVRGMLPKTALGRQIFRRLHVYAGPVHPHKAQNAKVIS